MLISVLFILIAIVVVVHGSLIVFWQPASDWPKTVQSYRISKCLSWIILAAALLLAVAISFADGVVAGYPLAASVRDAVREHPFVSGTVLISLVFSVVLALLDHMWINPMQRSSARPGGVFYAWFVVTFVVSLAINASTDHLLPTQDSTPEPIEARIFKGVSYRDDLALRISAVEKLLVLRRAERETKQAEADSASGVDKNTKHDVAAEAARKLNEAQQIYDVLKADIAVINKGLELLGDAQNRLGEAKSLASKRNDDFQEHRLVLRKWGSNESAKIKEYQANRVALKTTSDWLKGAVKDLRHVQTRVAAAVAGSQLVDTFAIVAVGGLYALWTLSLLYRRIIDGDRLVGGTARTLAFNPLGRWRHPAQCVVVGPRHSGKTELLKSITECTYPSLPQTVNMTTKTTIEPVEARFAKHIDYDVSAIDCGGEFVGDQLDLLTNLRTDCLVIVLCASHLKQTDLLLTTRTAWDISKVHMLINNNYDIQPNGDAIPKPTDTKDPGIPTIGASSAAFFQAIYYATNRAGRHVKKQNLDERSRPCGSRLRIWLLRSPE